MKQVCTLLMMVLFMSGTAFSQTGKISGKITDAQGKGIASATVSLLKARDSALVKLALSDKQGMYEFTAMQEGKYLLSFTYIGYTKTFSDAFTVTADASAEIPAIAMKEATAGLSNVTVQARRPMIEAKMDRMVVNVDASPTNAGATALDVLEKSPGVTVDRDGNISLKGKQGVIILMDGKPAYLSGQDLANLLRNMPSNQLDQIEIMTQPSAKYDASGNSGVINLRTKKNNQMGFNGSVSLSYVQGVYPKSPNSFNFNYRKGKVNLFSNLNYSYWSGFNELNLSRKFRQNGQVASIFDQQTRGRFEGNNFSARLGMDYTVDKKTTVGFLVNGTYNPRHFNARTTTNILNGDGVLDSINKAVTTSKDPWRNMGVNLNFRRTFNKPGHELTADVDYLKYTSRSKQIADNFSFDNKGVASGNPFLLRGNLPSDISIYSGKIDYVHPLNKEAKLEMGAKSSFVTTDNDAQYTLYDHGSEKWITDVARSNHFVYEENINAAYINYSRQIKKWGVQTGLRFEHTHSVGNQKTTGEKFPRDYAQLFPTAYLSYNMNDNNKWALSYGRRVERPNYQDMNPFQRFLDQYTYQQGNPYLTPQFSHNIELTHNFKSVLNTTLNYNYTTDIINDILKQNDATKVTFQTKENIAKRRSIGLAV
ncbi:MAG: TonB-dependent receptor, partial [Flavisolibacter sp.]|nr:TonB-dependent receptor [Flavisolibacter sp.]